MTASRTGNLTRPRRTRWRNAPRAPRPVLAQKAAWRRRLRLGLAALRMLPSLPPPVAHAVHVGGDGGAAAAPARAARPSLAALLTGHILRDGEVVQLILRPSLWFIALSSLPFLAVVTIGVIAAKLWLPPPHLVRAVELGLFLAAGRLMWAVLQWAGRLYVLTDMRIVRIAGVFNIDVFDCPLRKVAQARLNSSVRERMLRLGSVEIVPRDESCPPGDWRTVSRPDEVLRKINAAVERARHGGGGSCPL